jgi:uncharacterized protein (TIGR02118 family)
MLTMTFCLRRLPSLTWTEFSDYWRDVHAPLVRTHAPVLGIRRYVQLRTIDEPRLHQGLQARNGGSPEPYDGVAQVWVDDLAALRRPSTAEGQAAAAALLEDERRFLDLPRSPIFVGSELIVIGSSAPAD